MNSSDTTRDDLERRERILSVIGSGSELLLEAENWEDVLPDIIRKLGKADNVSRMYVIRNTLDDVGKLQGESVSVWAASGVDPFQVEEGSQTVVYSQFGLDRWVQKLKNGELISGKVDELPDPEQSFLSRSSVKSILIVPIFVEKVWWGFLGFDECANARTWSDAEINALRTAAGVLGAAIERQRSDKVLKESEERFRSIAQTAVDGFVVAGTDQNIRFFNWAAQEIFGYSWEEVVGENLQLLIPEHYREKHEKGMERYLNSGEKTVLGETVEFEGKRKNGEVFPIELSLSESTVQCETIFTAIIRDISNRKQKEENLQLFRTLLHHSNDAIEVVDPKTAHFIDVNDRFCDDLGYTREELLEMTVFDIDPVLDPADFEKAVESLRKSGSMLWKGKHRRKDGSEFPVEVALRYVSLDKDYIVAIARDITDRQKVEETLRLQSSALEAAANGILITDADGTIQWVNTALCELTGYNKKELVGENPRILKSGEQDESFYQELWETILAKEVWTGELVNKRKDGVLYTEEQTITPIQNATGEITHYIAVKKDITQRKEAEASLKKRAEDLALVNSVDMAINQGRSIDQIWEIVTAGLRQRFAGAAVGLYRVTDEETRLVLQHLSLPEHLKESIEEIIGRGIPEISLSLDQESPYKKAIQQQAPQILYDKKTIRKLLTELLHTQSFSPVERKEIREQIPRIINLMGIKAAVIVPLITGGKTIGCIDLYGKQPFNEKEIQRLTAIADQFSVAVTFKLNQEKLAASGQDYRHLFENMQEGVYRTAPDGEILLANSRMAEIFGFESPDDLTGNNVYDIGLVEAKHLDQFRTVIEEKNRVTNFRFPQETKDGRTIYINENAWVVRDDEGNILYYEGTYEDITQEKELEQELIYSQKTEALGQIAGGIAHDFNNVLASLSGTLQMLEIKTADEEIQKYFDMGQSSIDQAQAITDRLVTFTRRATPHLENVSLVHFLQHMQEIVEHSLPKDIEVRVKSFKGRDLLLIDKNQVQQVVINLCINAADAMPKGGAIELGIRNPTEEEKISHQIDESGRAFLCLTVADTGSGIKPEILDKIFDPFFSTKEEEGTGLGLSVVRKIIRNHNGWIDVQSTQDVGTEFTIGLPASGEEVSAEDIQATTQRIEDGHGEHILLVEDEQFVRELLEELLRSHNYTVTTAEDGLQGAELFKQAPETFDLVFTDIGLPAMSGVEMAEHIHSVSKDIPIIASTGYIDKEEYEKLKSAGFQAIVRKPFDFQEVLRTITQYLKEK